MINVLKGGSGYDVVYRIDGNNIVKGGSGSGYDVAYRIDGNNIVKGGSGSGYDVAYRIDGNNIVKGGSGSGYDVAYRIDSSGSGKSKSEKTGVLAFLIAIFIAHPIGNIVLGLLIAIGLTLAEGGSFNTTVNPLATGNFIIGGIITAIGVFRLFRRWKKRK